MQKTYFVFVFFLNIQFIMMNISRKYYPHIQSKIYNSSSVEDDGRQKAKTESRVTVKKKKNEDT